MAVEDQLAQFILAHECIPAHPRPNTTVLFHAYDDLLPPLPNSPSPFIIPMWETLLSSYPGDLPLTLSKILEFGALVGYDGPNSLLLSKNHTSVNLSTKVFASKIESDLITQRISVTRPTKPFICSPLGLVPKKDGGFRRIHDLSFPRRLSVNDHIEDDFSTLQYVRIEEILQQVLTAGRHSIILKRDIKDAFRNIPVAPQVQWLLGFRWEGQFYKETCLPFGLAIGPFIFNLFAEGFY